jgi:hypothetical protein
MLDRRNWRRHGADLAEDAEAFLSGDLAERFVRRYEPVPVWAWTNLLAHAAGERLRDERGATSPRGPAAYHQWRAARSYLAAEVLDLADACGPLAELQRGLLLPLELRLAECPAVECWLPQHWVAGVDTALRDHRRARERAARVQAAGEREARDQRAAGGGRGRR